MNYQEILNKEETLDPENWEEIRRLGHKMVDDVMDMLMNIKNTPSWKPVPQKTKDDLKKILPSKAEAIEDISMM